jgi:hypothetical protein
MAEVKDSRGLSIDLASLRGIPRSNLLAILPERESLSLLRITDYGRCTGLVLSR